MDTQTATTETTTKTFRIPEPNVERLIADFARITKRAKRIKVAAPVLAIDTLNPIVETSVRTVGGIDQKIVRTYFNATVTGETPKLPGGWTFAATLTRVEDGNIIASLVGEVPAEYRETQPVCDHCKLNRIRKETFLVVNETAEWKQVGRNCLGDFLGSFATNPERIVAMAEMLTQAIAAGTASEDEGCWGGGFVERAFHLGEFLSYVAMLIRTEGWMGRKEAREKEMHGHATADQVMNHMRPSGSYWMKNARKPEAEDMARAEAAIEWASEIEVTNDFTHNLRLIARHGFVEYKHFGIAAYIPMAYARMLADAAKAKLPTGTSNHFGEVGKRAVFTFTVANTNTFPGAYGLTTLVTFRDAAGNVAKWFASGEAPETFKPGATVTVKATIKGHGEYKGTKETTLARVAVETPKAAKKAQPAA